MIVTIITDGQPYIFEKVTYISIDRDSEMFYEEHHIDIELEEKGEEDERTNKR